MIETFSILIIHMYDFYLPTYHSSMPLYDFIYFCFKLLATYS